MDRMIEKILACPACRSGLKHDGEKLKCAECERVYKISGGVPVFIEKTLESEEIAAESFKTRLAKNSSLLKVRDVLSPPDTTYDERIALKEHILRKGLVLNLGSSSKKVYPNTINLDIGKFDNVDVVADGKKLPFKNGSFDVVLIESVLEHVDEPEIVIKEAHRVLKKGGKIFISIPFVFAFHGSPNDFGRYTLNGLKRRLSIAGFSHVKGGVACGAGSTFSQILRYYLALLFSFNSEFLFSLLLNVFGWLTFFWKYTDILLNRYKKAHLIASCVWAAGIK